MSFSDSINANNLVVNSFITVSPSTQFTYEVGNQVDFIADSLTGSKVAGSYWFDDNGIAQAYAFLSTEEGSDGDYFARIMLSGELDSFYNHAGNLYFQSFNPIVYDELLYAWDTGYGQNIADWIDALPGALGYGYDSTTVSFNGEDFYYA